MESRTGSEGENYREIYLYEENFLLSRPFLKQNELPHVAVSFHSLEDSNSGWITTFLRSYRKDSCRKLNYMSSKIPFKILCLFDFVTRVLFQLSSAIYICSKAIHNMKLTFLIVQIILLCMTSPIFPSVYISTFHLSDSRSVKQTLGMLVLVTVTYLVSFSGTAVASLPIEWPPW